MVTHEYWSYLQYWEYIWSIQQKLMTIDTLTNEWIEMNTAIISSAVKNSSIRFFAYYTFDLALFIIYCLVLYVL